MQNAKNKEKKAKEKEEKANRLNKYNNIDINQELSPNTPLPSTKTPGTKYIAITNLANKLKKGLRLSNLLKSLDLTIRVKLKAI